MTKFFSLAIVAAIAVLGAGFSPMTAGSAEAKTANQIKNENKGKAAKAKSSAKSAARKSKK